MSSSYFYYKSKLIPQLNIPNNICKYQNLFPLKTSPLIKAKLNLNHRKLIFLINLSINPNVNQIFALNRQMTAEMNFQLVNQQASASVSAPKSCLDTTSIVMCLAKIKIN